jgi:hypothetical protein
MMTQVLGDIDRTLVLSNNPLLRAQKLTLSPADAFVLSRVDGVLTAREVFQIIPLPQEDTERSLFALLCTGTLEFLPRTATSRARAAVEGDRAGAAPSPARPAAATSAPRPPEATPAARPAPPAVAPAAPPAARAAPVAPPAARPPAAPPRPREDPAASLAARRQQITDAHDGIKARDFFEFLGVPRDADERQVKDAYFRMAKPFHPDTPLDPALADLKGKREAVFLHLGHVYETLRNPANRSRYERLLDARAPRRPVERPAAPAPAAEPVVDRAQLAEAALEAARNGARLLKEGKYWDAIQVLEPALPLLEGPPLAKARVTLARAYMKNPNWLRRAEDTLQAVLQDAPEYAEAYVVLGQVYRASEQRARAVTMYRRALELQPGNAEAQAELASLEPGRGTDPGSGKILKKLFGKS